MLDLLRRHSRSWMIWVLLGGIILVFVFFFGYNSMPGGATTSTLAMVNGQPITAGEFELAYDNTEAFYRRLFNDEIPEAFRKGLRPQAMQRLIQQKLLVDFAHAHQMTISDTELAQAIRALEFLQQKDGAFDPMQYQQHFLPGFAREYKLDFETMLREELLAARVRELMQQSVRVSEEETRNTYWQEETQFTFEFTTLDPATMVDTKTIATPEEATTIAEQLQAQFVNTRTRKKLLTQYGLTVETKGPSALAQRTALLGAEATDAQYAELFGLANGPADCAALLKVGPRIIVGRLVERTEPTEAKWNEAKTDYLAQYRERRQTERLERWSRDLVAKAKIEQFIDFDQ